MGHLMHSKQYIGLYVYVVSVYQLGMYVFQWVPIFQDGQLLTGEMSLPVSVEKLPPHYSLYRPEVSTALFFLKLNV